MQIAQRIQWMRNREGGQPFGNQEEIRELDEDAFRDHLPLFLGMAEPDSLAEYRVRHPKVTHYSVIRKANRSYWQYNSLGSLEDLRPKSCSAKYALSVASFDSLRARIWGEVADSEVYH